MSWFPPAAPIPADAVALLELGLGVALLLGAYLARRRRIRAHAYLQSAIVLGNLPIVLAWMLPSYLRNVLPSLTSEWASPFYLVPTLMLALGAAVEVLGVYVVLVAGTNWLPERLRFRRYRLWMGVVVGLWWVVLTLGLLTYYVWYVGPPSAS